MPEKQTALARSSLIPFAHRGLVAAEVGAGSLGPAVAGPGGVTVCHGVLPARQLPLARRRSGFFASLPVLSASRLLMERLVPHVRLLELHLVQFSALMALA